MVPAVDVPPVTVSWRFAASHCWALVFHCTLYPVTVWLESDVQLTPRLLCRAVTVGVPLTCPGRVAKVWLASSVTQPLSL